MIGYPWGLPAKVAGGAKVNDTAAEGYFTANLDAFGGNSGSVVINDRTGKAEGILVRGATDWAWDPEGNCRVSNVITGEAEGEDVTKGSAFVDELRGAQAGAEIVPTPDPESGALDPALLARGIGPQIWQILRQVQRAAGAAEPVSTDMAYLSQEEISALPRLLRDAVRNDPELRGSRFIRADHAARAIAGVVVGAFRDLVGRLSLTGAPLTAEQVGRIPDPDLRLVVTLATVATYGGKVFQPAG